MGSHKTDTTDNNLLMILLNPLHLYTAEPEQKEPRVEKTDEKSELKLKDERPQQEFHERKPYLVGSSETIHHVQGNHKSQIKQGIRS